MSDILVTMTVFHTTAAVAAFALMAFGAIRLVQDNRSKD
jgi:hypothetical protein